MAVKITVIKIHSIQLVMALYQPQVNMVGRLDPRFNVLSNTDANDEDIVCGVLQAVLEGLPLHIAALNHHTLIKAEGFCVRSVLSQISRTDLTEMGLNKGHAIAVHDIIRPPQLAVAVEQAPVVNVQAPVKSTAAPPFPAVLSTGLPTARDLTAWMPGVYDALRDRQVPSAALKQLFTDPKTVIPVGYDHGGAADQALWSVLVRCRDGLPTDLVMSFPKTVRDGEQGLSAWKHLFERVLIVTDQSIQALQNYFDDPPKQPSLLQALNKWSNIVEELEAVGCKPWDPSQRSSLEKIYSNYGHARRAAEALEAVHDSVPVDVLLKSLTKVAFKLS